MVFSVEIITLILHLRQIRAIHNGANKTQILSHILHCNLLINLQSLIICNEPRTYTTHLDYLICNIVYPNKHTKADNIHHTYIYKHIPPLLIMSFRLNRILLRTYIIDSLVCRRSHLPHWKLLHICYHIIRMCCNSYGLFVSPFSQKDI